MQGRPVAGELAAHIVAGRQGLGAEIAGGLQQVVELDRLVAAHTGDRGLAAQIGVGELLDHRLAKPALIVEHIVGDADGLGGGARIVNVLARAAGALLLDRRAVVVELQGHPHHVIAGALEQSRRDGGIHPAGHGRDHPRADGQADRAGGRLHGVGFGDVEGHGGGLRVPGPTI